MPVLLIVVHVILFSWATIGMAEWLLPEVPWPLVSNPAFPRWLLLMHWLAVFSGAITFLGGYLTRWPLTPVAVALAYAFMAVVCIIETFWFLTGVGRFVAMALEFGAYIGIVVLLLRHPAFVSRFSVTHGFGPQED